WSTRVPSSVLPYGRVSTVPAEAVIVRVRPRIGRSEFLAQAYGVRSGRLAREPPDGLPRFRCHVHRIDLESTQRTREDLDACRGRGMLVDQDEGASAERAEPTAAGRRDRERLEPDLCAELGGHPDEFVEETAPVRRWLLSTEPDRKSTRLNSSHGSISYAVFCLKKKRK